MENICRICGLKFTAVRNLNRHVKAIHEKVKGFPCSLCYRTFSRKEHLGRHMQKVHQLQPSATLTAPAPKKQKPQAQGRLEKDDLTAPPPPPPKKQKTQAQGRLEEDELLSQLPPDVEEVYRKNWSAVKTHKRYGKHQSVFTFFWTPNATPLWRQRLVDLFDSQKKRFKINFSHSFLLKNKTSNELSFFHASANNHRALKRPRLISNKQDFLDFVNQVQDHDALEHAQNERPDSKVAVEAIMSTSFYVNPIADFPIGCCTDDALPEYIQNNKSLHTLQTDQNHGQAYRDNLCFFRALALHRGANVHSLQIPARELFNQWSSSASFSDFPGVTLLDLPSLEDKFKVNIDVFQFDESQSPPVLVPLQRSAYKYTDVLRLLHYKQHFMHIIDIDKLTHAFQCPKCGKLWKKIWRMERHEQKCQGDKVKETYQGGVYQGTPSVLESLQSHGFSVDTSFVFPYRATFDFEVYFDRSNLPQPHSNNTRYTAQHVPLSVSVASNVPDFESPVCFVSDGDSQNLIDRMVDHLEKISDRSYLLLCERFSDVLTELDAVEQQQNNSPDSIQIPTAALKARFDDYLRQLPVIGFNSGKYDINVIKPYLVRRFVLCEKETDDDDVDETKNPFKFVVKRHNAFLCICTQKLKFLDVVNFLAPGFSYAKYLAAYNVTEQKGFFPYEHVTSLDTLQEQQLPPHAAFYSTLKQSNITDEQYAYCQQVWETRNMTSMRDFLMWYNNLDVVPFLQALDNQITFYATLGVDMVKDAISAPGITLRYLFKTLSSDVYFSLFDDKTKDIHSLLRDNITGGPSIIFHRHHEKSHTFIRNDLSKPVQSIEGFDANALYLWALCQNMPTEHPIIRKKENNFKGEKRDVYGQKCREWLEWVMFCKNIHIRHKFNSKEKQLGKRRIRVDGWHSETQTVYQFHGCLFHGHENCSLTRGRVINPFNKKPLVELREKTREITAYLQNVVGVAVQEMWECEWERKKKTNPQISTVIRCKKLPSYSSKRYPTENDILAAVKDGTLFGLVQCDLHVPEALRERFSEMTPIFKNIHVTRSDIGPFMRAYAEKYKLLTGSTKTLIGSYVGNKVLLATPLLKWYLENGLIVTAIYLVIEYQPKPCFKAFGDMVTSARRQGDSDPSKNILSETFKLLGNSAYGKTLTNIARHCDIYYVGDSDCEKLINDSRFQKLTELTEDLYEVEMAKKNINWGLPLQIGYFVYQYAKLKMLQFYYDCVDKFVDRSNFQLCEMDTDSLYMALAAPRFEDAVRPELQQRFFQEYTQWFPGQACDQHHQDFVHSKTNHKPWDPSACPACLQRARDDKRTPGLFKTEYTGDGIVALCSKTYICFGDSQKLSTKGLNKHQNQLDHNHFKQVLQTQQASGGCNTSFKTDGKSMFTYQQHRNALSYLYIKRKVLDDGVTTVPLDI
ncbi:uncharacterized protein LOC112558684 isoform X2 [Pomacea canaliculata]|uniref:uncharacterized protein LOC112558684 isoform X2 n=1 Tax=Pomacea canaliculata TaxID=400727 RepID=UPI000D728B42|nr:uncharacterized protein LOC112558684 isoform X2 [Pomacea canaliculata]